MSAPSTSADVDLYTDKVAEEIRIWLLYQECKERLRRDRWAAPEKEIFVDAQENEALPEILRRLAVPQTVCKFMNGVPYGPEFVVYIYPSSNQTQDALRELRQLLPNLARAKRGELHKSELDGMLDDLRRLFPSDTSTVSAKEKAARPQLGRR